MIYCSDFSLLSSYLEGASLTSSLFFSPGLQIVLSHREMCHGAAVCSTAVTQFRDFFTRTASAGGSEIQQGNQTRRAPLAPHLQNPGPAPRHAGLPRPPRTGMLMLTQGRRNNVNTKGGHFRLRGNYSVCYSVVWRRSISCTNFRGEINDFLSCCPAAGCIFKQLSRSHQCVSAQNDKMFARGRNQH